jgi:hypothetical protein
MMRIMGDPGRARIGGPVAVFVASACSSDVAAAQQLLVAEPGLTGGQPAAACAAGDAAELQRLLAQSPQVASEATGPCGWPPILYACFSRLGRLEPERAAGIRAVVAQLLAAGADPQAEFDHDGWRQTTLYGAAGIAHDPELTGMLLAAGADPNDDDERHTVGEALYHAVEAPDPECARLLVEAGTRHETIRHCLGRALNFDRHEMVAMLCAHVRPRGDHLAQAVWRRRPLETVTALLDAGARVEGRRDGTDPTPLRVALAWDLEDVAELLRQRGADPAAAAGPAPDLDEMLRVAVQQGDLAAARRLIDAGAPAAGGPGDEFSPVREAAWRGRAAIVAELVGRRVPLTFSDGSVIGAALHGSRHCVDPEGGPTMATVQEIDPAPYAEVVRILLEAGAPVPSQVGDDEPPVAALLARLGIEPVS